MTYNKELEEYKALAQQVIDIKTQRDVVRARNKAMLLMGKVYENSNK